MGVVTCLAPKVLRYVPKELREFGPKGEMAQVSPLFTTFWGLAVFFLDALSLTESLPGEGETE